MGQSTVLNLSMRCLTNWDFLFTFRDMFPVDIYVLSSDSLQLHDAKEPARL